MLARLVFDHIQRNWRGSALAGLIVALSMLAHASSSADGLGPATIALGAALFIGPIAAMNLMTQRELRHLPVTNQDLWRLTWTIATVFSSSVVLVSGLVGTLIVGGLGGRSQAAAELSLLFTIYTLSWTGVMLRLFVWTGYAINAMSGQRLIIRVAVTLAGTLAIGSALMSPVLLGERLPTRFDALTPAAAAVLVFCLAISAGSFFWTPQRTISTEPSPPEAKRFSMSSVGQLHVLDRLTGVPRIVIPDFLLTLVIFGVGFAALQVFLSDSDELASLMVMSGVFMTMRGPWTAWTRLLRVMPISIGQLNALLTLTPAVIWAVLWIIAGAIQTIVGTTSLSVRPAFAFGLAGIAALGNAVLLCFAPGSAGRLFPALLVVVLQVMAHAGSSDTPVARIGLSVVGATALFLAAAINGNTLRQSDFDPALMLGLTVVSRF